MGDTVALPVRVLRRGHQCPDLEGAGEHAGRGLATDHRLARFADAAPAAEPDGFDAVLQTLPCRDRVRGVVVHDARIAALCLAHGVDTLMSRDRDFSLFPELRTVDPLA